MNTNEKAQNEKTGEQNTTATEQRDAQGRFVGGNKGGPGNPFARQTARLRKAAMECVSEQDIRDIMEAMKEKARKGSESAAKIVMSYSAGKPDKAPDPDTLDQHEMKVLIGNHQITIDEVMQIMNCLPVELLVQMFQLVMPILVQQKKQLVADIISAPVQEDEVEGEDEDEEEEEDEGASEESPGVGVPAWMLEVVEKYKTVSGRGAPQPKANGENGRQAPQAGMPQPKGNGENGRQAPRPGVLPDREEQLAGATSARMKGPGLADANGKNGDGKH